MNKKRKMALCHKNNRKKMILTSSLEHMDAITIIQDLDPPNITKFFRKWRALKKEDINKISITVEDHLSGIEAKESSFSLKLNETVLYPAFQPIQQKVSYNLDNQLERGSYIINFKVKDRMENESSKTIYFSVY